MHESTVRKNDLDSSVYFVSRHLKKYLVTFSTFLFKKNNINVVTYLRQRRQLRVIDVQEMVSAWYDETHTWEITSNTMLHARSNRV